MLFSSVAYNQAGVCSSSIAMGHPVRPDPALPQEGASLCSEARSMSHSFSSITRRTGPGSLTCRDDFAKEATRCVVAFSHVASLLSSSTRVLGTKLQERPRAGFSGPVLLSLVTWLVTCNTNRLIGAWEKQCHSVMKHRRSLGDNGQSATSMKFFLLHPEPSFLAHPCHPL